VRPLMAQPSPVEQVYHEILSEIVAGRLPEYARLIQDEMARDLGRLPASGATGASPAS